MADSELVSMTGDPTPVDSDIFYGTDSGGTVDKKFTFDDTATYVESKLDVIAAGTRTTPDTGTPGEVSVDVALSGGIAGGDTLTGGTAASEGLILASTAHATRGTISARDAVVLLAEDKTTSATVGPVIAMTVPTTRTFTMGDAGGGLNANNTVQALAFNPLVVFNETSNIFGAANVFQGALTVRNQAGVAKTIAGLYIFASQPSITADGAVLTAGGGEGYRDAPALSVINTGTLNATIWIGFVSRATVNASATLTTRTGFKFEDSTGAGTVTTAIGVDVAALSDAATSIGIRNASTTVNTPLANTSITATSATIRKDASLVTLTANASYTLASTPTIADGVDGQRLTILNVDTADTITLQDQGTLASSNLRLSATTIALGPRDSIELVYSSTVGDWVQVGQTNVI